MAGVTYGSRGGRVRVQTLQDKGRTSRSAEEVVREIKASQQSAKTLVKVQQTLTGFLISGK